VSAPAASLPFPAELVELIAARAAELVEDHVAAAPEPWIGVDQAAEYLACKPQRIYDLVSQDRLEHRKEGRRLLFRRAWIDEYLEREGR